MGGMNQGTMRAGQGGMRGNFQQRGDFQQRGGYKP
jgi:hypothetical protein